VKLLDIAIKDLLRSFRSAFALVFMFVIPLLTVGLFYFAFGGLGGDDGFDLAATKVQVVNLDEPGSEYGDFSAGHMLVDLLESENLSGLLEVSEASGPARARAAVDAQEAAVAVIIPADFTGAALGAGSAAVELYQDPTLTLGPGIVKSFVSQIVDGFAGAKIATGVAVEQLVEQGVSASDAEALKQEINLAYGQWATELGEAHQDGANPLLDVQSTGDAGEEGTESLTQKILSTTMVGMMIFYAFFTAANASESILREEEAGTLPRLFTTPTPQSTILGGKLLAVFVTILVQVIVLVVIAALAFGVAWGAPLPLALATLGLVVLASSFGVFLTSLLKNTKQTGIVFGGVMTVTGMVGISSVFTASVPAASDASQVAHTLSLLMPQGWALHGWRVVMDGGGVSDVLVPLAVMLALGAGFFVIGVLRFRKRFA